MFNIDFSKISTLLRFDAQDPLLFNSSMFLFLFVILLAVYGFIARKNTLRTAFLLLASFYFYYRNSGIFVLLLLFSSLLSYYSGWAIYKTEGEKRKRMVYGAAIILNLLPLLWFKYAGFFLGLINPAAAQGWFYSQDIIMPLGISFFTFKALSYIFDIYLEKIEPENNILNYTLYVSFFPSLLAGPIDRAGKFLRQLKDNITIDPAYIGQGTFLIMSGLIKKDVIADYISINFVDRVFGEPLRFTGVENLLAVYGYALQIYCDFSGYSDLAIGIAMLLGFKLMDNFNYPYKAKSVSEFWRRWHISLSSWLLDYLFKPMQMSLRNMKIFGNALALLITFLVCGLWHGASWTFIAWGGIHGLMMVSSLLMKPLRKYFYDKTGLERFRATGMIQTIITFHLVAFAWVFFKAGTFDVALSIFSQIFTFFHAEVFVQFMQAMPQILLIIILGYALHFMPEKLSTRGIQLVSSSPLVLKAFMLALVIWIAAQARSADLQPFIYFQF